MSRTVTYASAEASAVSGSALAGNDDASVVPSSGRSEPPVAAGPEGDDEVDDDEVDEAAADEPDAVPEPSSAPADPAHPARSAEATTRTADTARARLTAHSVQGEPPRAGADAPVPTGPRPVSPGWCRDGAGRHVSFALPPANTSPHRLAVQDAALSRR